MGLGGALYRRDKDGGPWVPPWWFSFILLPVLTIATFYMRQAPGAVVGYVGFYYVLILPIFVFGRRRWQKKQKGHPKVPL